MKNLKKNYLPLSIFVIITVVGLLIRYLSSDKFWLWEFWSVVDTSSAVALGVLAFMGYKEYIKGEDNIKIYFQLNEKDDKRKVYTKLYTQRKYFTRGEVLGLLRMIQCSQDSFVLKDFNQNPKILERFEEIQLAESNELVIKVSKDELKQFNVLS